MQNIYDMCVVGSFFSAVVRSQHKPMYECNFEASSLSNFFLLKEFIGDNLPRVTNNLPTINLSRIHGHCCCKILPNWGVD